MASKKINLKSSVSAINAKSAVGKKKPISKLKVILANPYKPKCETLIDNELSEFKDLISSEIKLSGISGRLFAKQNNIQLGLGSSLRAIGNKKASCVLISQSIKPKFIIDQIWLFAKQTNNTIPVFIINDWDKITTNLFGVRALVVVLPSGISGELGKWILKRTLPTKEKQRSTKEKEPQITELPLSNNSEINLNSMYLTKPSNGSRAFIPDVVVKSEPIQTHQSKEWTGDFISFSNQSGTVEEIPMDMDEVDEDFQRKQDKALETLQRIAQRNQKVDAESKPKVVSKSTKNPTQSSGNKMVANTANEEWENDIPYISLEVHKIQPNPNRKPKNKRKNKKQKAKTVS